MNLEKQSLVNGAFNVARARRDTPGCENVLHFNNAGAALMPTQVLTSIVNHLRLEARIGGYEAANRRHKQVEMVYQEAAALLGCDVDEIAIVENATRAWDMVFYGLRFNAGDRILTANAEYGSNLIAYLQVCKRTGARVDVVPNDQYGQVSIDALREMIDERVKLISITHVPTNGGLVNPAAEVGKVARAAKIPYLLDACQSVGQMPLDVRKIGCDMLSATGRKYLRGPRGTGFLYVRREFIEQLEPPFLDVQAANLVTRDHFEIRPDARRFENWEAYYAGRIGLGVAINYARSWGLDTIWRRVATLGENLRAQLRELAGVTVHDLGKERCGIVSFSVQGHEADAIQRRLSERKINTSVSLPEDTRLDSVERGLTKIVRASLHYYNDEKEIERFCQALPVVRIHPSDKSKRASRS